MKCNRFLAAVSGVFFLVYALSAAAADEKTPGKGSDTPSVKENPAFAGKMERTPPRRPHGMGHFRRPGPEHFRRPGPGRFPGHLFSRFTPEEQVELREFLHKKDRKMLQNLVHYRILFLKHSYN